MAFSICYITCPNDNTATELATQLLQKRLVACANILPINSCYWWQNDIQNDQEKILLLKTRTELLAKVEQYITMHHPYTTPCILHWQVTANAEYEAWIHAETEPM